MILSFIYIMRRKTVQPPVRPASHRPGGAGKVPAGGILAQHPVGVADRAAHPTKSGERAVGCDGFHPREGKRVPGLGPPGKGNGEAASVPERLDAYEEEALEDWSGGPRRERWAGNGDRRD